MKMVPNPHYIYWFYFSCMNSSFYYGKMKISLMMPFSQTIYKWLNSNYLFSYRLLDQWRWILFIIFTHLFTLCSLYGVLLIYHFKWASKSFLEKRSFCVDFFFLWYVRRLEINGFSPFCAEHNDVNDRVKWCDCLILLIFILRMTEGYFTYELQIVSKFQLKFFTYRKDSAHIAFNCIIYSVVMAIV